MDDDYWTAVVQMRLAVADLLERARRRRSGTGPSLCAEWRVRDVAGHLSLVPTITTVGHAAGGTARRVQPAPHQHPCWRGSTATDRPDEIVARIREHARRASYGAGPGRRATRSSTWPCTARTSRCRSGARWTCRSPRRAQGWTGCGRWAGRSEPSSGWPDCTCGPRTPTGSGARDRPSRAPRWTLLLLLTGRTETARAAARAGPASRRSRGDAGHHPRSPRARWVSTTNRAPMNTAANATQTATSPPVTYAAAKAAGV